MEAQEEHIEEQSSDKDNETKKEDVDEEYVWEEVESSSMIDADEQVEWDEQGRTVKGVVKGSLEKEDKGFFIESIKEEHRGEPYHVLVWDSLAVLKNKLDNVGEGDVIKIKYLGKVPREGKNDYKNFKVTKRKKKSEVEKE